jgi:hypothetical protein
MVSFELLLWCILSGAGFILGVSFLLDFIERRLRLTTGIPEELLETSNWFFSFMNFFMETLFYVVIPTIAYSFFYVVLPVSGIKGGIASALFAFLLGAVPFGMRLTVRMKLPIPYLLFTLLSHLLKLVGALAIIGYLYSL